MVGHMYHKHYLQVNLVIASYPFLICCSSLEQEKEKIRFNIFSVVMEITKIIELKLNNHTLMYASLKDTLKGFSLKVKAVKMTLKLI